MKIGYRAVLFLGKEVTYVFYRYLITSLLKQLFHFYYYRFLGTGDQTTFIALDFQVGGSTVRMLYKEICSIIMRILPSMYLSPPTEQQWTNIAINYWKRWHMPNCFGAIDGISY